MAHEVQESSVALHDESVWYEGDLYDVIPEDGQYGPQLKWVMHLDDDEPWTDDDGTERPRETWTWCSEKLTLHEKNKFRKIVKWLTGDEPVVGELFHEEHYTKRWYEENDGDPVELTGLKEPWRVKVMFEHVTRDGKTKDQVTMFTSLERTSKKK